MRALRAVGRETVAVVVALLVLAILEHCGVVRAAECGKASWYGNEHHGRLTASGEVFDQNAMTAAMVDRRMLGKRVRVTSGDRSVVVRITDTGGFAKYGRVIDLSRGAFSRLAHTDAGVIRVCLTVL